MRNIDSIQRPSSRPTRPPTLQPPATGARFTKITGIQTRRRFPWLALLVVVLSPALFGVAWLGVLGLGLVVAYGVVVLVLRIPSQYTFMLALMALLYMVIVRLGANKDMAQALAVLVYFLLAIGVISLAVELKSARGAWFKKH